MSPLTQGLNYRSACDGSISIHIFLVGSPKSYVVAYSEKNTCPKYWWRHCTRQLHGLPHTCRHKACRLVLWVLRNYTKHDYLVLRLCVYRAGSWRQATPTRPLHTAGPLWLVGSWIWTCSIYDAPVWKLSLKRMCSIWLTLARVDEKSRRGSTYMYKITLALSLKILKIYLPKPVKNCCFPPPHCRLTPHLQGTPQIFPCCFYC